MGEKIGPNTRQSHLFYEDASVIEAQEIPALNVQLAWSSSIGSPSNLKLKKRKKEKGKKNVLLHLGTIAGQNVVDGSGGLAEGT